MGDEKRAVTVAVDETNAIALVLATSTGPSVVLRLTPAEAKELAERLLWCAGFSSARTRKWEKGE